MTGIRDWGAEGATPEELALLRASRSEQPSADARARALAALGVGTMLAAASTTTAAAASTTAAAATTSSAVLGVTAKLVVVLAVAGGVAGGVAWHARHGAGVAPAASAVIRSGPAAAPVATPSVEATASSTAAPEEPPAPSHAASPVRSHPTPSASGGSNTLVEEVHALEKAHAALAAHDPEGALRALDRYHARFAGGALASEEKVLRVKAELARGNKNRAAAAASELKASDPESPFVKRVDDLVNGKKDAK